MHIPLTMSGMGGRNRFVTACLVEVVLLLASTTTALVNPLPRNNIRFDQIAATTTASCILLTSLFTPIPANAVTTSINIAADSTLFKPNPLTNSVLEQIRIWEQAEADNLKYGGELERGDAKPDAQAAYPRLLMPILQIQQDLVNVQELLVSADTTTIPDASIQQALKVLQKPSFAKIAFKKIFNSFGDNIYYADPDRANLYLGGGATPQASQSLAYLYRNDILTNVEDLTAELEFLRKNKNESPSDAKEMINTAVNIMQKYLDLVPPNEVEQAKKLLSQQGTK